MKTFRAIRQYRKDFQKIISSNISTHARYIVMHISNQKIQVLEMNTFTKVSDHMHPFYRSSPLFNCQTSEQKSKVEKASFNLTFQRRYSRQCIDIRQADIYKAKDRWQAMLTFFFNASNKRITNKTHRTGTYRAVVHNLTAGIKTTYGWTWVQTFLVDTSFFMRTVSAHNTFWSTCWWWTNMPCLTWTDRMFIYYMAYTVQSTWRREAKIPQRFLLWYHN